MTNSSPTRSLQSQARSDLSHSVICSCRAVSLSSSVNSSIPGQRSHKSEEEAAATQADISYVGISLENGNFSKANAKKLQTCDFTSWRQN